MRFMLCHQLSAVPDSPPCVTWMYRALLATVLVAIMLPALLLASTIAVSVMTVEAPAVYTATCTDVPYVIISTCFMYCVGVVLCLHCIRRLRSKHVTVGTPDSATRGCATCPHSTTTHACEQALQSTVRNELVLVACELAVAWLVHIALVLSGASLVGCTTVTIVMAVVLVATTVRRAVHALACLGRGSHLNVTPTSMLHPLPPSSPSPSCSPCQRWLISMALVPGATRCCCPWRVCLVALGFPAAPTLCCPPMWRAAPSPPTAMGTTTAATATVQEEATL